MHKALGSIPSTKKKEREREKYHNHALVLAPITETVNCLWNSVYPPPWTQSHTILFPDSSAAGYDHATNLSAPE
jgi:hypothetical protein